MRPKSRGFALGLVIAASVAVPVAAPVAAQGPTFTEVVGGLDSPRGVALGSDGTIYVAEAGKGGTAPCVIHPELGHICFGDTGRIAAVVDGVASDLVTGLPSAITDTGETIGPSGVTVDADGVVWFLVGGPGAGAAEGRDGVPDGAAAKMGQLYRVGTDGTAESVVDLAAYETANNPDAAQPGNEGPDSNANGLTASDGSVIVADAGGNDLLQVAADGTVTPLAVFPVSMQPVPVDPNASPDPNASVDPNASPAMIPMDPVPTSVVVGPDGAYYVGQLTGFPFPPGGASVFRVVPGEDPTVYASGFTNVIGLAFGSDGSLYVLEISHDGLANAAPGGPPMGGLWKVPAGGGTPELIASDGLVMPGGLAMSGDGTLYISTCAVCAGGGSIVSFKP
jgi:sugar lactone lactonase YvrE